ncbi:MAG: cytochrome c oxidase subunit I, partial [Myxococcales bacterium]
AELSLGADRVAVATDLLDRVWATRPGFSGWFTAVNHRTVGLRYMATSLVFLVTGGIEALIIRLQLARPELHLVEPETFNQLFTMHGSTMMFLFGVPFLEGLAIYVTPLMIGTRDMAFPRLNAFSYWIYLFAGIALHWALLTRTAPNAGWFNYPPLSGPGFAPGPNVDYWVTAITMLEVAALTAAVELVVTIFKQRAPGMALWRIPLFVWSILVFALMIIFAMPTLVVTSTLLALDRMLGAHFFHSMAGGEPLLWQHLFWFFGHPDVYILLAPALGVISTVVPVFVGRRIAGYTLLALSLVGLAFLSFGLWVHHMYAAGLPLMGMNFFAAASMMVVIPSSIQIFAWIRTLWTGHPRFEPPLLFALGFIVLFILGGITGIMVASVPFDWQVHDTYFVVAHFHYVLIGGVVFPIICAIYFWFPKVTGRMLGARLGRWNFWLIFVGFNVTFFPLHIVGLQGMARRVYTYLPGLGFEPVNLVSTAGALLLGVGFLLLFVNIALSLAAGKRAGPNPWGAATLEWATESPPPQYNFALIREVDDRDPLWLPDSAALRPEETLGRIELDDPANPIRETLVTSVRDALPESKLVLPGPTTWPFFAALSVSVSFLGALIHPAFVPIGGALLFVSLLGWFWPRGREVA